VKRARRHAGAPLLLGALCCALGGLIFFEAEEPVLEPTANAAVQPDRTPATPAADEPGFAMPPLSAYAEVLARPVFSESRRPPSTPAVAAEEPQLSSMRLVGIVVSASARHALVEHGQPPRLERIVQGQEVEGWTVEAINATRVVLRRGDSRIEIKAKDMASPAQARGGSGAMVAPPVAPNLGAGGMGIPGIVGGGGRR
jgi:hypothetical protein